MAKGTSSGFGKSGGITGLYTQMEEQQRAANEARKTDITGILDQYIKMFEPGGAFGKGFEAQLGLQKVQDVGKTAQRDISRGLYGIRPYEQEWEATVGSTARLKLEDLRMENLSKALLAKAGFLERIEEPYPDYTQLMSSMAAGASAPSDRGESLQSWMDTNVAPPSWRSPGSSTTGTATPGGIGPGAYSGQNVSADPNATYGNLLGGFNPEEANKTMGNVPSGEGSIEQSVFSKPADTSSYPTMTEALKQGVGAIGRNYQGSLYKLTEKGWVSV